MINSNDLSAALPLKTAEPPLYLAPMAGITDAPFRCLCRASGGLAGAFAPMIGARAVLNKGSRSKSLQLIDWLPGERRAVQLFGGDIAEMRAACALMLDLGAEEINLNLGCQMPKIIKNGGGAIWLRHTDRALELLLSCAEVLGDKAELSVKLRLGWERFSILPLAERLREAGVERAFVHGRLGVQAFDGHIDKKALREVVLRSSVPVYANGDITDFRGARAMLFETGCSGLMIGRGALGNPGIFASLRKRFRESEGSGAEESSGMLRESAGAAESGRPETGSERIPDDKERLRFAAMHIDLAERYMREGDSELSAVRRLRRHMLCYGLSASSAARAETFEQLRLAVRRAVSEICFF